MNLSEVYIKNALNILATEQDAKEVYAKLSQLSIQGSFADFLSNPFIATALSILKSLSSNYKIAQALQLLKEAGAEAEKEQTDKKKKRGR